MTITQTAELLGIVTASGGILSAVFIASWKLFRWLNKIENQKIYDLFDSIKQNQDNYFKEISLIKTALSKILQISEKEWTRNGGSSGLDKITKTKEMVNTLLEKEEINFYLDSQPKYECDSNGLCIKANYKWRELTGLSENDALGNQWIKAIHPNDRDKVHRAWENFISKEYPFEEIYRIVNLTLSKIFVVRGRAISKTDANGIELIVGTFEVLETKNHEQNQELVSTI